MGGNRQSKSISRNRGNPRPYGKHNANRRETKNKSISETKENTAPDTITPPLLDKTKAVQVSPLGLGPFPEIPKGFPYFSDWSHRLNREPKPPDWPPSQHSPSWDETLRSWELMDRVKVELWRQGIKATGVRMQGTGIGQGLIYPTIPGVVYIERVGDRIEIMSSHEDDDLGIIDDFHELEDEIAMETGRIPEEQMRQFNAIHESGFRIEDIPQELKIIEGGINPYTFLNLK